MTLAAFVLSVAASLGAVFLLWLLYAATARWARKHVATAECWWLPGANSFRFVLRNMPSKTNLSGVRYRVWLRTDAQARDDISVTTLLDDNLAEGERLLLPAGQDLPLICFRFQEAGSDLELLITDKMGVQKDSRRIAHPTSRLMIEFSARARTLQLFKHEVTRLYAIQQGGVFREKLLPMQSQHEQQARSILEFAHEVSTTV